MAGFRGNKSHLPDKPCVVCGRPMTWRKAWAKTWDDVKCCSTACQRNRKRVGQHPTEHAAHVADSPPAPSSGRRSR
ncbi:MAG: DUF2256 domain-containing protein [Myxococcales bacterium]|nr:DUF2256 domain-containing protein [Myxococcales bacterium]